MNIDHIIEETYYWLMDTHCPNEFNLDNANDNSSKKLIHNSLLMVEAVFNFIKTLPKDEAGKVLNHINMLIEIEIEGRLKTK